MRVLVVDTYYEPMLREHYAERPGLEARTYAEQHASLMARCFGTADAYSRGLRALGHQAAEVVANCAPLQRRWAAERGIGLRSRLAGATDRLPGAARRRLERGWLGRVLAAQVAAHDAEVVYVQDMHALARPELDALRAAGRLVAGQIASPPPDDEVIRGYQLVVTSFPHFVERFRALGVESEYLPLAFPETVTERLAERGVSTRPQAPRPYRLAFVGALDPHVHPRGFALLEYVARVEPMEVWGYGVERAPRDSPLRRSWRGQAWGLEMYGVLARSRVVLNRHIDAAEGHANNMRLFEATGAGAALVTEQSPNLADLFESDREVATYRDEHEAVAVVRRLLGDDDERRRIASAGQVRTLRDHTYSRRMPALAELLEARLAGRSAEVTRRGRPDG